MPVHSRAAAKGARAERIVATYLEDLGYCILSRNVHVGHYEIDLLARIGSVIAVVEVRYRGLTSWQSALDSITPAKRARIKAAGSALWEKLFEQDPSLTNMRFDVACVTFGPGDVPAVEYLTGAIS